MTTETRLQALENVTRPASETVFILAYEGAPEPIDYRHVVGERYTVKHPIWRLPDGTLSEYPPDPGPSEPA